MYEESYDLEYENFEGYYQEALEQVSIRTETLFYGSLLISEILKQNNKMVCLASKFLLIADIDCGDKIDEPIEKLRNFVDKNNASFLIYKTKNGMRYLQTDIMYQGVNKSAINTLKELGSDPKYLNLCEKGGYFMARLTPKFRNPKAAVRYYKNLTNLSCKARPKIKVCQQIKVKGIIKAPAMAAFEETIALHEMLTQSSISNKYPLF